MILSNSVPPQTAHEIDVTQAFKLNEQGALLLDVREPNEYAEIHAPNSTLIPLGQLKTRFNELAAYKDKSIAVICRSGVRSAAATQLLLDVGYGHASNVRGGIIAWERAGLAVSRKR